MLDLLPMPHTVEIQTSGKLDNWGLPVKGGSTETVSCRISYNTKRETITAVNGEEIVFSAEILLSGLPKVTYDYTVSWVDFLGNKYSKKPLSIQLKQDISGNPVAVKVVL